MSLFHSFVVAKYTHVTFDVIRGNNVCLPFLDKPKVILVAPTGVAAVNIDGRTIHAALGLPVEHLWKKLPRLSDKRRTALRNKLSELRVLIIDEISMVSNLLLLYIHMRLVEIFGCSDDVPFAGLTIIAVGDFYQLPPVQQRTVYADYTDDWQNLVHLWKMFKITELQEVIRQRGDSELIDLLNKVRTASLDEHDEFLLKSKFITKSIHVIITIDALHIFAENLCLCKNHNFQFEICYGCSNVNILHGALCMPLMMCQKVYSP